MSGRVYLSPPVVEAGTHRYTQDTLRRRLRARLPEREGVDKLGQLIGFVYANSAIEHRHLELSSEQIDGRSDWYRAVNEATFSLASRTLSRLFEGQDPLALDALVVVSASYAGFPALSRRLQAAHGLSPTAQCYDLSGLGCAGPTHALHLAHMLVTTGACDRVCVLCVDAMGTHGESRVHNELPTLSQVVAHCLASDGAAAVVVGGSPPAGEHLSWSSCTLNSTLWPESLGENDFTACALNQPYIAVGKDIRTRLLDELGPTVADLPVAGTLFHPGGAALVRSLGSAYPDFAPTLARSSAVLREHGNIGAASLLWVLREAWTERRSFGESLCLVALGPGIVSTILQCDGLCSDEPPGQG